MLEKKKREQTASLFDKLRRSGAPAPGMTPATGLEQPDPMAPPGSELDEELEGEEELDLGPAKPAVPQTPLPRRKKPVIPPGSY